MTASADIAFTGFTSTDGKFGGLRAANTSFFATKGSLVSMCPACSSPGRFCQ